MARDRNRFDLLRLLFAAAVAIYHLVLLGGIDPDPRLLARGAEIGVQGFFVISGALVWRSLARSGSLARYAEKRARRILPAYVVIILVPAAVSLALVAANGGGIAHLARYVAANLVFLNFLEPTAPHLFADNPHPEVNGALWTIKIEVMFYAVLPLLAVLLNKAGPRGKWALLALVYVAAEAWRMTLDTGPAEAFGSRLARQLPGQMAFFASGIALAWGWAAAQEKPALCALVGAPLFALSLLHPALEPLRAAGLAGLIGWAAFAPGPALNAARWGDLSYGLYICHFPIIQTLTAAGLFAASPALGASLAAAATIAAALAMWRWVEAPFLLKDSHYHRRAP